MTSRILVADDEPQIRRVMLTALTSEGYVPVPVKSALEAFEKLRQERFDLVLLDVNMPGMSGLEACSEIRSMSEIPIIMLTVRNTEEDKIAALDAGADDYVTKPFSMPELLARIRSNLRRSGFTLAAGPAKMSFGEAGVNDVEVNLATRHVIVRGRDVRFTPKEFDLLHYLLLHPDMTIPHSKLLQAVWGPDYGNEIEYLHVFVNQIRKKIELNPASPRHLLTEPRIGYRFSPQPSPAEFSR